MAKNPISDSELGVGCIVSILFGGLLLVLLVSKFNFQMSGWLVLFSLSVGLFVVNLFFVLTKPSRRQPHPVHMAENEVLPDYNDSKYLEDEVNKSKALSGFYECSVICDALVDFLLKTGRNVELVNRLNQIPGIPAIDRFKFGAFNTRLFSFVVHDVCKCYEIKGHDTGSEILCALLLYHRGLMKNPHEAMEYAAADRNFSYLRKAGDDILISHRKLFNIMCESKTKGISDDSLFILPDLMRHYGYEPDEYIGLLDRLAAHIEETDKKSDSNTEMAVLPLQDRELPEENSQDEVKENLISGNEIHSEGTTADLNELIGLEGVKKEVGKLSDFIRVQKMRSEEGLKVSPINCHCVFTGNPGTGKTTVARIMAGIFKDLGILKKGHLVETDRSGLVAEYIGQTAVKANKLIDEALDGVLFIDEAYSLLGNSDMDYGREAISTLLKRMEDDRGRLVVILAGYSDEMEKFINSNPGLRSRFNRYIHFNDYSAEELWQIFSLNLRKLEYVIDDNAASEVKRLLEDSANRNNVTLGNARYVRNIMEKIIENQASRIASDGVTDKASLQRIVREDISLG